MMKKTRGRKSRWIVSLSTGTKESNFVYYFGYFFIHVFRLRMILIAQGSAAGQEIWEEAWGAGPSGGSVVVVDLVAREGGVVSCSRAFLSYIRSAVAELSSLISGQL